MAQTAQEIRRRWDKEHMAMYSVWLNKEKDAELIAYIEKSKENGHSASSAIKSLMYKAME